MRLAGVLIGFALLLVPAAAAVQEEERIAGPLSMFFPRWADYLSLEDDRRSHFTLGYQIRSDRGVAPADIRMHYEFGGETREFIFDAEGYVLGRPAADVFEADPEVWINQPEGGMGLSMRFMVQMDPATRYSTDELRLAAGQANDAMRSIGGVAAMFAPQMRTVVFVFDGPAPDAWGIEADGERRALTVQENRVTYRPRERRNRRIESLQFGREPVRILLDS
ncbi:hypothetical protein [Maricaulis sp.]|uniref:hypothetical protein n=1 Tax=Maricaulis sp. TaxID=1486257 RepID=UPI002608F40F|nr:hypothetical protein [Maricaulis sp.]